MIDNTKLYINKNVYIEMVGFFLIISLKGILNFLLCPFILFSEKKKYDLFLNENDTYFYHNSLGTLQEKLQGYCNTSYFY